jgi:hypothetical protein
VSKALTDVCVRVDCLPHGTDDEYPVRLSVLSNTSGATLVRLLFTPSQAEASARGLSRVLAQFLPADAAERIGAGLKTAAVTVWATRN